MTKNPQTIQVSDDYTIFKRIAGNREPNKTHVRRLKEAIESDTSCIKYNPILINEKMQIIDGQHRLEAIKELSLPVYYIQEPKLNLENVQSLNSLSKTWTPNDYAYSYSELGNKNYDTYLEFKKRFDINHDVLLAYLGLSNYISPIMFKTGKLVVENKNKSENFCSQLVELGEYYKNFRRRSFALAALKFFEHKRYDHQRMIAKMKLRGHLIEDLSTPEDYARALEKVYNNHAPTGGRIKVY